MSSQEANDIMKDLMALGGGSAWIGSAESVVKEKGGVVSHWSWSWLDPANIKNVSTAFVGNGYTNWLVRVLSSRAVCAMRVSGSVCYVGGRHCVR